MPNYAVQLYANAASNPNGIPGVWPAQIINLGSGTTLPTQGVWQLMTDTQFAAYLAANMQTYTGWQSTYIPANQPAPVLGTLNVGALISGATLGSPLSADINGFLTCGISGGEIAASDSITAPVANDQLMGSMTIPAALLPAGKYKFTFSCDLSTTTSGAVVSVSFYVSSAQDGLSLRKIMPYGGGTLASTFGRAMASLSRRISVNGSQVVEVWWSTSAGTVTAAARSIDYERQS